jgi:hypothetical protein
MELGGGGAYLYVELVLDEPRVDGQCCQLLGHLDETTTRGKDEPVASVDDCHRMLERELKRREVMRLR